MKRGEVGSLSGELGREEMGVFKGERFELLGGRWVLLLLLLMRVLLTESSSSSSSRRGVALMGSIGSGEVGGRQGRVVLDWCGGRRGRELDESGVGVRGRSSSVDLIVGRRGRIGGTGFIL